MINLWKVKLSRRIITGNKLVYKEKQDTYTVVFTIFVPWYLFRLCEIRNPCIRLLDSNKSDRQNKFLICIYILPMIPYSINVWHTKSENFLIREYSDIPIIMSRIDWHYYKHNIFISLLDSKKSDRQITFLICTYILPMITCSINVWHPKSESFTIREYSDIRMIMSQIDWHYYKHDSNFVNICSSV